MSDIPQLDVNEQVARIERAQVEARKFVAEANKLNAEHLNLMQEALKLERDRWLAPALAIAAVISGVLGGVLGTASFIARLLGR